jgi:glycosyltransferase involved in cell wall biosynthesis
LLPLSKYIFVFSGFFSYDSKKVYIFRVIPIRTEGSLFTWINNQIISQIKASYYIIRNSKKIDIVIFFLGGRVYAIPMLIAKILKKKVIVTATGSAPNTVAGIYSYRFPRFARLIAETAKLLESFCFMISDQIAVESQAAIKFLQLNKYKDKIAIYGSMYINTDFFKSKRGLKERGNMIGFIGRLSQEKGIMNFVKAIPLVLRHRNDFMFLIVGGGELFNNLQEYINKNELSKKVILAGWIPHNIVPDYLNELKLLVLPSFSEGIPGIVQEAMACGTPVLATPVGGIPDLIKDCETGFILRSNSPECIAKGILKVLEYDNIEKITENARKLIEEDYSYLVLVEKCKNALLKLFI